MAEKVYTASDAIAVVEKKLKCFCCHQNFTHPKSLPCLHVFCQACLESLPNQPCQDVHVVECPVCDSPAQVPKDGISGFLDQSLLSDLGDVPQLLTKVAENQKIACGNCDEEIAEGFCQQCESFLCQKCIDAHHLLRKMFPDHCIISMDDAIATAIQLKPLRKASVSQCSTHKKPLAVYCQAPCDKLVCNDCTILNHKHHECHPISDEVFTKHQEEIKTRLQHTQQELAFLLQVVETLDQRAAETLKNRDRVKDEIRSTAKQMIAKYTAAVEKSVDVLEERADSVAKEKRRFIFAQRQDTQKTADKLQSCVDYVDWEVKMGSPQQVLVEKKQMVDRMKTVTSKISREKYSVTEEANIKFVESMEGTNVGRIESFTHVAKCEVTGENLSTATAAQKSSFTLSLSPPPGHKDPLSLPTSLISAQISVPNTSFSVDCDVLRSAPGEYEVSYRPITTGSHQLRVRVGEVDIPGSPFTVQVERKDAPIRTIRGLARPWGVVVGKNGNLLVTEQESGCVVILDAQGKVAHLFGGKSEQNGKFDRPRGIAFSGDNILVVDSGNYRLQKFDSRGNFLAAVGSRGSGPLQFDLPRGVCVGKGGRVYVADSGNHRVQVLNPNLTFSHSFGKEGSQPGEFKTPFCMAMDDHEILYVVDRGNHCVQKFTTEGDFIAQFGKEGKGEGKWIEPGGIAIDTISEVVYVSSYYKISAFSSAGEFITELGNQWWVMPVFNKPTGLALDKTTGHLHICDFGYSRLASC